MFPRSSALYPIMGAVLLSVIGGCGDDDTVIPHTAPVSGTITINGEPLEGAQVAFTSKLDNKSVKAARGLTDANGGYTLTTYLNPQNEVSGATPGEFRVTVKKTERPSAATVAEQFTGGNPAIVIKNVVPDKYANAKSSPFTATVTQDGENKFDFNLED